MPMKPFEFDRRYGEMDQVIRAHVGQRVEGKQPEPGGQEDAGPGTSARSDTGAGARDTETGDDRPLRAYLRHTWHTRPWALPVAEQQLRTYARTPPGRLRHRLGEFYAVPDVGLPQDRIQGWLFELADKVKRSVEKGEVPPFSVPETHWEWHARFPELGQFLGGWFSQEMPDEFAGHDAAVRDYTVTTGHSLVARLVGEIHELLALDFEEPDYALALAELGMEVDPPPPYAPSAWLAHVADRLGHGDGEQDGCVPHPPPG